MEVGTMRSRITIQKAAPTVDEVGNHTNVWIDYHSCFASVNLVSGKEYAVAGQIQNGDTLQFVIRWCKKIRELNTTQYRIVFQGDLYNIISVDEVLFRHESLKLIGERVRR